MRFDGQVAIVTGAGGGLGRAHALAFASRGARVVVNDFGGARDGTGGSTAAAAAVVDEIQAAGGEAIAHNASVTDAEAVQDMVQQAVSRWSRVDILVNNAGVLRDKTFSKMTLEDFRYVIDVHVGGAVNCTKAVWDIMRAQNYGRIVLTTSSSGLYGNFGQSNYSAAKMALVGLMQTLGLEGDKYGIRVNCVAPSAATRMTHGLLPENVLGLLEPHAVTPAVLFLASRDAPTRAIICAGAGSFERAYVTLTRGQFIGAGPDAPEKVAERFSEISDRQGEILPLAGSAQIEREIANATHPEGASRS